MSAATRHQDRREPGPQPTVIGLRQLHTATKKSRSAPYSYGADSGAPLPQSAPKHDVVDAAALSHLGRCPQESDKSVTDRRRDAVRSAEPDDGPVAGICLKGPTGEASASIEFTPCGISVQKPRTISSARSPCNEAPSALPTSIVSWTTARIRFAIAGSLAEMLGVSARAEMAPAASRQSFPLRPW